MQDMAAVVLTEAPFEPSEALLSLYSTLGFGDSS